MSQKFAISILILSLFICNIAFAKNSVRVVRVGVVNARAPFAAPTNNSYNGIVVDIWKTLADNEKITYKYIPLGHNTDAALNELVKGNVDVVIGPISVTYQRYKLIDFSHPYFLNETGLIIHKLPTNIGHITSAFFAIITSPFIILFLLFFLIYIHVYWFSEKADGGEVPEKYSKGISYVIWTHLLKKYHLHLPHTFTGRLASLIWILAVAALLTSILATVTSEMTSAVTSSHQQFNQLADLQNESVAVIKGTRTASEIEKAGAKIIEADSLDQAVELLNEGKVAAVADDYIIAKTYLNTHDYPELQMSSLRIASSVYAIAVKKNEPLLQKINRQILFLQDNGYTQYICEKYINADADLCAI